MTPLALRLLTVLALFLPAASESARLILANGDDVRDIAIVSMQVPANEVVHHIDHNRSNNAIENLALMTVSEHSSMHAIENNPFRTRDALGRFK